MNKKFCQSCNQITYYEDKLPAGCSHCLQPFAGTVLASIKPAQIVRPIKRAVAKQIEQENEEIIPDEEYQETRHHDFKVEIEVTKPQRQRETLGGIALDRSEKFTINRPREKATKNKKKFQEDWAASFDKGNKNNSIELGGV